MGAGKRGYMDVVAEDLRPTPVHPLFPTCFFRPRSGDPAPLQVRYLRSLHTFQLPDCRCLRRVVLETIWVAPSLGSCILLYAGLSRELCLRCAAPRPDACNRRGGDRDHSRPDELVLRSGQ